MIQPLPAQSTPANKPPILKELKCPTCGAPLAQVMPNAQTLICGKCGSHVALGAEELSVLGKGVRLPEPPVPIRIGQRFTLAGTNYFVLGRVIYEGSDDEESWRWTEWLLGASDGRLLWLSYDKEDGFVLFKKLRIRQAFNPMNDRQIPVGEGKKAFVTERYPARIIGAEGELTFRAAVGDRLTMVEGAGTGKKYSIQVNKEELEVYEGDTIEETDVATAVGDAAWQKQIVERAERRKVWSTVGLITVVFAMLGFIAAAAASRTGDLLVQQSVRLSQAAPVSTFQVNFDTAGRPAIISLRLLTSMMVNAAYDIDVSVISPNEQETFVYDQEFYYETGVDEDGTWTETRRDGQELFVPFLTGTHTVELTLDQPKAGDNLLIEVTVRKNHVTPTWLLIYGGITITLGLLMVFSGQGVKPIVLVMLFGALLIVIGLLVFGGDVLASLGDILEAFLDA